MPAKGQRVDKRTGKLGPSPLQERAARIMHENPAITPAKAMIMAHYSKASAVNAKANLIDSKGFANLGDIYQYEVTRKGITPKFLAKKLKEGLIDQDKKVVALYHDKAEKVLELSKDTPDTAIQINLGSEVADYAE